MSDETEGVVFPVQTEHGDGAEVFLPLMSLRDWFAGQALGGILAEGLWDSDETVIRAYQLSDQMMAERAKEADDS